MNRILALLILTLGFHLCGCASLQPGADPVVVRAQQAEQVAFATFDTYLRLVHQHESRVRATVPAALEFAEWLREKRPDGQPRGLAMVQSLGDVRRAYAAHRTPEKKASLTSAIALLQATVAETQKHLALVKPSTP